MLTKIINGIIEYFKHDSTWRGVIVAATTLGLVLTPEQADVIVKAGAAVFAAFEVFIVDRDVDKG